MIKLPNYNESLKNEYRTLFDTCEIDKKRLNAVNAIIDKLIKNRPEYEKAGQSFNIPWFVIGLLHHGESGMNFKTHLHNGDPLTARTKNEPKGRPVKGKPPFTWEESAKDALEYDHFHEWKDWSLPGCLYKMELYNGWGSRKHGVWSAYLWAFSSHYTKGKYVKDKVWSYEAVHENAGTGVLLRRMVEKGLVVFKEEKSSFPLLKFGDESEHILELQKFLNRLPVIQLKEDGIAGERTSEAFKEATGYYLPGDDRR